MQNRILAGCTSLIMAAAIIVLAPSLTNAAPGIKSNSDASGGSNASPNAPPTGDATTPPKIVFYPRSNYVWPFASGPVYGSVDSSQWRNAGVVHTNVGSFDLTRGMPNLPSALLATNRLETLGTQHFLLQVDPESFTNGLFDQMKAAIVSKGGAIVGEMPVGAFIVRMTPDAYEAARGFGSIIALEPYHPAFKLSPDIGRSPLPDPVKAVSSVYSLGLRLFEGENAQAVTAALSSLGVTVKRGDSRTLHVDADRSKLAALAAIDAIEVIYEDLPIFPRSEETTSTVQTGRWNGGATPYTDAGVDGGGSDKVSFADDQLLMVLDTGIQLDAGDLSNTRTDGQSPTPVGATHRKVQFYGTTNIFGGAGDLLGCDNPATSGFTHGHMVSVIALGNATRVPAAYGTGWQATDLQGNPWDLDGIAPKARLIAYDALVTPSTGNCDDPNHDGLLPGTIYTSPSGGSLADGYAKNAKIVNFSWGNSANSYVGYPQDIDQFLTDKPDAMVFVAVGNDGKDANTNAIPDPGTLGSPGTLKNGIGVGASANANDQFDVFTQNRRTNASSCGPVTGTGPYGRIQPILMSPGADFGAMGIVSEFTCRSNDNDQNNPVECDIKDTPGSNTSWAAPGAAGAALLVRDYFSQGFYPDGTASNPGNATDKVSNISGSLVKAILVASADWMHLPGSNLVGSQRDQGLTQQYRFNREQGYGRVQLTRVLPLQSYSGAVTGLIVDDGGFGTAHGFIPAGAQTSLSMNLASGANSGAYTLNVCDNSQPLTVAIAWVDPSNTVATLSRDLNLEVTSPAGIKYLGNFFTDDANLSLVIDGSEECTYTGSLPYPSHGTASAAGKVDQGPWSLPVTASSGVTCTSPAAHVDSANPVEAVFLSPDSANNGTADVTGTAVDESADNQVELGGWTVQVFAPGTNAGPVNYAIAISGGVCLGSSVRIQKTTTTGQLDTGTFTCNDSAVVTVSENGTTLDPSGGLTTTEIGSRTTVEVIDPSAGGAFDGLLPPRGKGNDYVVDCEGANCLDVNGNPLASCPLTFTDVDSAGAGLRFDSGSVLLTDGTAPTVCNGKLEVRNGEMLRVTYADKESNVPVANLRRINDAMVDCRPVISAGGVVFGQFGKDAFTLVSGGCEKDARGYFTFGFPDRYMDAGELVGYLVAFQSGESDATLQNVTVSLKAVATDADSPADCKPGAISCSDPNRLNNPPSPYLTVLDSPKVLGTLPPGSTITPSFTIQVADAITGVQQADMILGVSSKNAGKGIESVAVQRETLNADEVSFYYSTDFPTGGSELVGGYDINNNEVLESTTNSVNNFLLDYVPETRSYSDLTAGGYNSAALLKAPWNFDTNDGGFTSGINNTSFNAEGITIALWGEDKNFNNRLDGICSLSVAPPFISCENDNGVSQSCFRCANDLARPCSTPADCIGTTTCDAKGTCDYTRGEDRDQANGLLDRGWNTQGGCGWQSAVPGAPVPTGGVWHTGLIGSGDPAAGLTCTGDGIDPQACQTYERFTLTTPPSGSRWWEMLLTPVLNKVNQCPTANGTNCPRADIAGDPVYQVAITDWAWNMEIDIADVDSRFQAEFDTDIDKLKGAEFYNDTATTSISLRGKQGAISGGNAPITSGFNLFAPISKCTDTDGVGSCSVRVCNGNTSKTCTGASTDCKVCSNDATRSCTTNANCVSPGTCTGNIGPCNAAVTCAVDTDCTIGPAGQTCTNYLDHCGTASGAVCTNDTTCTGNTINGTVGNNREGKNNCYFEGRAGVPAVARAKEPYGLSTPPDDDVPNSYCERSDSLNGIDKSVTCNPTAALPNARCKQAGGTYTVCHTPNGTCSILTTKKCIGNGVGENLCNSGAGEGTCTNNTVADEFVQKNGPGRNYGIQVPNGPDMRFTTLEDFYGDTGKRFQGAFTFRTSEPTPGNAPAPQSYGIAVDDMVVSWKETRLDEDTHTCAGNAECADIEVRTTLAYEAASLIEVTVSDKTPYDAVNNKNDCNGDGDYTDIGKCSTQAKACTTGADCTSGICNADTAWADDQDCNNNGKLDVTVKMTSDAEVAGEVAVLDAISVGSSVYKTLFPYSTVYNSAGTLFVQVSGTANPVVTALYNDRNDGTGAPCGNALDPTQRGLITASTTVGVTAGRIDLKSYAVLLHPGSGGDDDGFPDANETIDLEITFTNKSGLDLDDLTATLGTSDPKIECISKTIVTVPATPGPVPNNTSATSGKFVFKVADITRTSVDQSIKATFDITLRSKQFDAITRTMQLTLDMELSASGGGSTLAFLEDFDSGPTNFGKFTLQTLDAGKNSLANSNGMRCQYNDPDFVNSNSGGNADCFLGFKADGTTAVNDWHVHTGTPAQGGVGRAYTGVGSAHWGVHNSNGNAKRDTGRMKQLDAIVTVSGINMPLPAANPELVFAHQVSLVDNRGIGNITAGETADRAVVQVNVLTSGGQDTKWVNLQPYENVYEQQGTDDFFNCSFDPTDDGNNEDVFFDPTDPNRRLGPSSTCYPEFVFSRSGDTDYRNADDVNAGTVVDLTKTNFADAGSGLKGAIPVGVWVRPRFSLLPYAARRIKLRFLGTSIELAAGDTWDSSFFSRDDVVADDGWYVDAIRIDSALNGPLTIEPDALTVTPLATCTACSSVTATLTATPNPTGGPGQIVTLNAKDSTINSCPSGIPQYQFWGDVNGNGIIGDAGDTLLRDYTDNSTFIDAPQISTNYGVKVRCSSQPSCTGLVESPNAAGLQVNVPCPASPGTPPKAMLAQTIKVNKASISGVEPDQTVTVSWIPAAFVDAIKGDLSLLKSQGGNYSSPSNTVLGCLGDNVNVSSLPADTEALTAGQARYYLVRPQITSYCNQVGFTYSSGHPKEVAGRDAILNTPPACAQP